MSVQQAISASTRSWSKFVAYGVIALAVTFWGLLSLSFLTMTIGAYLNHIVAGIVATGLWVWVSYPIFIIGQWLFNWKSMLERERNVVWISDLETDITGNDDELVHKMKRIAKKVGLPRAPTLGINNDTNAFAFSYRRDNGVVVVGKPLVNQLSDDELAAVMAHEVGHIASQDALISSAVLVARLSIESIIRPISAVFGVLGVTFAGVGAVSRDETGLAMTLVGLALMLALIPLWVFYFLLEYGSQLFERFHSRRREFQADRVGALVTNADAMIGALKRLHGLEDGPDSGGKAALAQFNIVTRGAAGDGVFGLFATHPTLSRRIQAIEQLRSQVRKNG